MKFIKISATILLISLFAGCSSQKPGEYSCICANTYNNVDIPLDIAWQKAIEVLNSRWEITANDVVDKTLTVRTFYHDVTVQFTPLTANTCKFDVSSKNYYIAPNKAAVQSIYIELDRALKALEN